MVLLLHLHLHLHLAVMLLLLLLMKWVERVDRLKQCHRKDRTEKEEEEGELERF